MPLVRVAAHNLLLAPQEIVSTPTVPKTMAVEEVSTDQVALLKNVQSKEQQTPSNSMQKILQTMAHTKILIPASIEFQTQLPTPQKQLQRQ